MNATTGQIQLLAPEVIEKIAAGEVIERPASVVKELVENAIDAGSSRIDITVDSSGFERIVIADNGIGMSPENLALSVKRHATSKIRTAEDLFLLTTMGFRGEALAAISSVSRLRIESSATSDGLGYGLSAEFDTANISPEPIARTRGTTVTVKDLLYNVPARKKFMKSERAEKMAIVKMIEQLVIAFPHIHFTLAADGKTVLETPLTDTVQGRIAQVAGHEFASNLITCRGGRNDMEIVVYLTPPSAATARPRFQNTYVNLRRVDNESVTQAIRQAFNRFIVDNHRPSFFCFLDIDPYRTDVNVHPTKREIRFDNEREIFSTVFGAVKQGLTDSIGTPDPHPLEGFSYPHTGQRFPTDSQHPSQPTTWYHQDESGSPLHGPLHAAEESQTVIPFPSNQQQEVALQGHSTVQLGDTMDDEAWSLISCYQIHGTFILAPIKNGILLIDQHAAHERVLYEQALEDLDRGHAESQQLLFPIVVELSPAEKSVAVSSEGYFRSFGFELSEFGGNSLSVSAVPAFLKHSTAEEAIRAMIDYLLNATSGPSADPRHRFAAAFACGAAIKAGQRLDQEEMNALLNTLFATKNPYTCPHGRPTVVRMSMDELARRFLR